ncbi:MAG: glucokinase [Pseudomonadota bacterium]
MAQSVLVGDIGGTNVRLARAHLNAQGQACVEQISILPGDDFETFDQALQTYLDKMNGDRPSQALFAFAGPVRNGAVEMTNRDWVIDSLKLAEKTGLERIRLVNDYAAMSRGVVELEPEHFRQLHTVADVDETAPILVAGPGTGLGMATLLRDDAGAWRVLTGQGGHAMFAPRTNREWALMNRLEDTYGYVSNELVLSGAGFDAVHKTLCDLDGLVWTQTAPEVIMQQAQAGDPLSIEICETRSRATLAALGDAALINGAQGGVVITGGVARRLVDWLDAPRALARFFERGTMTNYMKRIPIRLLLSGEAALIGAASLHFDEDQRR